MEELIKILNELKDTFHNASQYHLKESEKYKFVDTSNKFNYHLGVSFGYGYAERELDNVIKDIQLKREKMTQEELYSYNVFLQYLIKGWMRPDKLPAKLQLFFSI